MSSTWIIRTEITWTWKRITKSTTSISPSCTITNRCWATSSSFQCSWSKTKIIQKFSESILFFFQAENAQLNSQLSLIRNTRPISARLSSQLDKFRHGKYFEPIKPNSIFSFQNYPKHVMNHYVNSDTQRHNLWYFLIYEKWNIASFNLLLFFYKKKLLFCL